LFNRVIPLKCHLFVHNINQINVNDGKDHQRTWNSGHNIITVRGMDERPGDPRHGREGTKRRPGLHWKKSHNSSTTRIPPSRWDLTTTSGRDHAADPRSTLGAVDDRQPCHNGGSARFSSGESLRTVWRPTKRNTARVRSSIHEVKKDLRIIGKKVGKRSARTTSFSCLDGALTGANNGANAVAKPDRH